MLGFGVLGRDQGSRAWIQMVRIAVSFISCMFVHHVCTWCLRRPEEGTRCLGIEVTDSCGCWDSNPDSMEEQPMLLTLLSISPAPDSQLLTRLIIVLPVSKISTNSDSRPSHPQTQHVFLKDSVSPRILAIALGQRHLCVHSWSTLYAPEETKICLHWNSKRQVLFPLLEQGCGCCLRMS